jgi:hypothetical protein
VFAFRWRWLVTLGALGVLAGLFVLPGPRPPPDPRPLPAGAPLPPAPQEMSWDGVDLQEVRSALPDNLYWELGQPTDDPEILALRQADAEARNVLFGAVQSGNATEQEIHTYYAEREQISRDYVAFAEYVLVHHGEKLAERDRGLLELAREMNEKRLAQLPIELERALARKVQQELTSEGGP